MRGTADGSGCATWSDFHKYWMTTRGAVDESGLTTYAGAGAGALEPQDKPLCKLYFSRWRAPDSLALLDDTDEGGKSSADLDWPGGGQ